MTRYRNETLQAIAEATPDETAQPVIILVEPQLGENIGMAMRAMANFGLSELRLVTPREGWPNERAQAAASRADHIMEKVRLFDTLEMAIEDMQFVLATTARNRDLAKPVLGPDEAAAFCLQKARDGAGRSAILFGRERWGLQNEEIILADAIVTLPVDPKFASLNIAQAVLLVAYEWRRLALGDTPLPIAADATSLQPAPKGDVIRLIAHFEELLEGANYFFPPEKREVMRLNLHNMLQKPGWSGQEISSLRGMLKALERNQ